MELSESCLVETRRKDRRVRTTLRYPRHCGTLRRRGSLLHASHPQKAFVFSVREAACGDERLRGRLSQQKTGAEGSEEQHDQAQCTNASEGVKAVLFSERQTSTSTLRSAICSTEMRMEARLRNRGADNILCVWKQARAPEERIGSGLEQSGQTGCWRPALLAGPIERNAVACFGLRNASRTACEGRIEHAAGR